MKYGKKSSIRGFTVIINSKPWKTTITIDGQTSIEARLFPDHKDIGKKRATSILKVRVDIPDSIPLHFL